MTYNYILVKTHALHGLSRGQLPINITITCFFRAIDTWYWPDADASRLRRSRGPLTSAEGQ